MGDIFKRAGHLLEASLTENTKLVYRNALSALRHFQTTFNLQQDWPIALSDIILFISFCFQKGYSAATIATYVAGVSFQHKIRNIEDPTNFFLVKKLLEGAKRLRRRPDTRAPILEETLEQICMALPKICFSKYEFTLFKAAFTLAYFGLLRVSEMAFTTPAYANRPLKFRDVVVEANGQAITITIRFSKTNQLGTPITLRIPASSNTSICPVESMKQYMSHRPIDQDNIFCHANRAPLTRSQFTGVLAKAIRHCGLPTGKFMSHSFRIGRATTLAMQGIPSDVIKKCGRWQSKAFHTYIRF